MGWVELYLKLSGVELITVFKEELVSGAQTGFHTILHNSTRPWRTG